MLSFRFSERKVMAGSTIAGRGEELVKAEKGKLKSPAGLYAKLDR